MQKSRTRNVESAQIFIVYTLYGAPKWVQTRLTEILNSGPVGGLPTKMDKQPISHTPALSSRFVNIISNWYFSSGWPTVCRRDLYGGIFSSEPETYYIRINKTRIGTNQCKSRDFSRFVWPKSGFGAKRRVKLPNRMIFWKSSKGGGGHFQSKNLCCRFWEL